MVWLNPIYSSPNDDNGYDISDYRNIMKEFGTMEDFDSLISGMHQRNIKMVKLRKDNPVLVYGKYELLDKTNPRVYVYTRSLSGKKILVLLNFTDKPASANTGIDMKKAKMLIDNYTSPSADGKLRPYEATVYQL